MMRAPEDNHVHIVVLHALVCRIGVVAHAGADAGNLVGRHADTDARAADQNAPLGHALLDGVSNLFGKVRIIVGLIAVVGAQIDDLMSLPGQVGADIFLQWESGVVGADDELHGKDPLRAAESAVLATPRAYERG